MLQSQRTAFSGEAVWPAVAAGLGPWVQRLARCSCGRFPSCGRGVLSLVPAWPRPSWRTWKPVVKGTRMWWLNIRILHLFKQRGQSEAVLSPPGGCADHGCLPSAGGRAQGRVTRMPCWGVSAEASRLGTRRETGLWRCRPGAQSLGEAGVPHSRSITKGDRPRVTLPHPPEYSEDTGRPCRERTCVSPCEPPLPSKMCR